MAQSNSGEQNTVVIQVDARTLYWLVGVFGGLSALLAVFLVGVWLGRGRMAGPSPQQTAYYAAQPQILAAQPQAPAAQPQVSVAQQPVPGPSRKPVGQEVPIGDNPRLAVPELAASNYVLDFGEVTVEQGPVTKEVVIRNIGVKDLTISSVQTTCSCTTATVEPRTIPPGGEATLRVTHDPQVMLSHGSTEIGHQVLIASNDPAAPWVEIDMSGTVVQ